MGLRRSRWQSAMYDSRVGDPGASISFSISRYPCLSEHLGERNDGLLGEMLELYRWF